MTIQVKKVVSQTHEMRPAPLGLAPLKSLRDLEHRLGTKRGILRSLAESFDNNYDPFRQAKVPKPHARIIRPPKLRDIDNPCKQLKAVQKRILDRLLAPVEMPHFIFGAVRNRCIRAHARQHHGATTIVKMDLRSYYPNITNRHVFYVWNDVLLCSPRIAYLLTKLTTYDGHLPQGAPSSPAIANILLASIYSPILQKCEEKKVLATAWVDDLIFSGAEARAVMDVVRSTLAAKGLRLSTKKTCILNAHSAKVITGVRLGKAGLRACSSTLRDIRAGIFNLERDRVTPLGRTRDIQKLRGKIAFIKSLCPSDAIRLTESLDRLEHHPEATTNVTPRCSRTIDLPFPPASVE
jgi:RNA-directed DNA polymerase